MNKKLAYFLWIGSDLPEIARISIFSSIHAGFKTILFTDRKQSIHSSNLEIVNWQEIKLPWTPNQVYLKSEKKPCYAAFSDLFRFKLLSENDGWWFDCDTVILRSASDFDELLHPEKITVGREDDEIINGAVIGSIGKHQARYLYETAINKFPVLDCWGVVGPALITTMIKKCDVSAQVVDREYFYPIHHNDVFQLYLPEYCDALRPRESHWYCLSLWSEVLSRSGLKYLAPPTGSYLANLLNRYPSLGQIKGDNIKMSRFLSDNLYMLNDMNSGKRALKTLIRKAALRLIPKRV
jgi:mannosyltransferase OCH1-like enzyme